MSRVGRKPITIPKDVKVDLKDAKVFVQGPKGKLEFNIHPRVKVEVAEGEIKVTRSTNISKDRALHGLVRSKIQNMVMGVTKGFQKSLSIEGVGFKAQVKGKVLALNLGFTHTIEYPIPSDLEIKCPNQTAVTIAGVSKQRVGQAAAEIRHYHEPEPYKGKGIRYSDEVVRRKQGKTVG